MINQVKHNSPSSVLSQFNPIASLKPNTRKAVNERFILPILERFFAKKGGIDSFSELDPDKLKTEIEFENTLNFVKSYIYKEIVDEISKQGKEVIFKPKYVITFDEDLANYSEENGLKYGVIRLGKSPILYYILIDLQQLIKFIKTLPEEKAALPEANKISETEEDKRNKLVDTVIFDQQRKLRNANETQRAKIKQNINRLEKERHIVLEGESGTLRIHLAWNTTDDLDLHVKAPNGEISYKKTTLENNGIIGVLDIDKNDDKNTAVSNPQENINFTGMPIGLHTIYVNLYTVRERNEVPFTITILPENEEGRIFNKSVVNKGSNKNVATFEYKNGKLEIIEL